VTKLDDADAVREQYAAADNLRARKALYDYYEGPDARDEVFRHVADLRPRRVLEVGGGEGELSERLVRELGVELTFVDQSEGMVELARARGLAAQVGDVQELPFGDASFDTAVAAWMLYHVPDLERGLAELARVLEPGGHLVAVTNGERHLAELRALLDPAFAFSFTRENGAELLGRHFRAVERHDVEGVVTVPDRDAIVAYRDSLITAGSQRPLELELPVVTRTAVSIFVAAK
jgi:SAM-dependent methyltransferase